MSEHTESRRWTLYICEECGQPGDVFQGSAPCNHGGRHHGKHGGPVEVIPADSPNVLTMEEAACVATSATVLPPGTRERLAKWAFADRAAEKESTDVS